jgi:hypothetical protein
LRLLTIEHTPNPRLIFAGWDKPGLRRGHSGDDKGYLLLALDTDSTFTS